jgi:hypothetical protein
MSKLAVRSFAISLDGYALLAGIDLRTLGYECEKGVAGERETHCFLRKRK